MGSLDAAGRCDSVHDRLTVPVALLLHTDYVAIARTTVFAYVGPTSCERQSRVTGRVGSDRTMR